MDHASHFSSLAAPRRPLLLGASARERSAAAPAAAAPAIFPPISRPSTNVFAIKFSKLGETVTLVSSPPEAQEASLPLLERCKCVRCKAVLVKSLFPEQSAAASASASSSANQVHLNCAFCGEANTVSQADLDLVSTSSTFDFILDEAAAVQRSGSDHGSDDHTVVFCVDTSGSMCVSTEVAGKIKLKGASSSTAAFDQFLREDGYDQHMPGQKHDVTYVTRLQSVKAAVEAQIDTMSAQRPRCRAGLVTFSSGVTVLGDGSKDPHIIDPDIMSDFDSLLETGERLSASQMAQSVEESKEALLERLYALEESGPTALGPALLVSVAAASQQHGSQVVLCTDGMANVGLGSLEDLKTVEEREAVSQFYEQVGEFAKEHGVSVSIISIEGTECRLEDLGRVADVTGGNVNMVNPLQLIKEFASILALPIIASKVSLRLLLQKGFVLVNEAVGSQKLADETVSSYSNDVGNVTAESELMFEYAPKPDQIEELQKLKQIPFQAQITFTRPDGRQVCRVITTVQAATTREEEAEAAANIEILSANLMQQSAKIAMRGDYRQAQSNARQWSDYVSDLSERQGIAPAAYQAAVSSAVELDQMLEVEMQNERMEGMNLDEEEEESSRSAHRRARRTDKVANTLFKMKKKSSSHVESSDAAGPSVPAPRPVPILRNANVVPADVPQQQQQQQQARERSPRKVNFHNAAANDDDDDDH